VPVLKKSITSTRKNNTMSLHKDQLRNLGGQVGEGTREGMSLVKTWHTNVKKKPSQPTRNQKTNLDESLYPTARCKKKKKGKKKKRKTLKKYLFKNFEKWERIKGKFK